MEDRAEHWFEQLIADVGSSVRLRAGRCSAISRELELWQAERYAERADEALNDWLAKIEAE